MRRLISADVIRIFEGIISKLATSEIFNFLCISVAEEAGLNSLCPKSRRPVLSRRGPTITSMKPWPGTRRF